MKKLVKLAVGAAMLGGLAVTAAAPADAGVAVGVGIGAPGGLSSARRLVLPPPASLRLSRRLRRPGLWRRLPAPPAIRRLFQRSRILGRPPLLGHRYAYHGGWRYR